MSKQDKEIIAVVAVVFLIGYVFTAFVTMKINCQNWDIITRLGYVILCSYLSLKLVVAKYEDEEQTKKP